MCARALRSSGRSVRILLPSPASRAGADTDASSRFDQIMLAQELQRAIGLFGGGFDVEVISLHERDDHFLTGIIISDPVFLDTELS